MKRKWPVITAIFAVLVIIAFMLSSRPAMNDEKVKAIADWLRSQPLKQGKNAKVGLLPQFKRFAARGFIDLVYLQDNKVAYFLKSTVGYKRDYDDYVYVDSGYPVTICKGDSGLDCIGIAGRDADPYTTIKRKISNNLYAVFPDAM